MKKVIALSTVLVMGALGMACGDTATNNANANANRAVTRRMLCEHLWDQTWEGVTNVIEVHINRLRAKIDRGFDQPLIHTIRDIGYRFDPDGLERMSANPSG